MATETLTVQEAARTGAELNFQSVTTADDFKFLNDGRVFMVAKEVNAANNEITVTPTKEVDALAIATRTVDVAASETWVLGPWNPDIYNDSDGYITFGTEADEASGIALVRV